LQKRERMIVIFLFNGFFKTYALYHVEFSMSKVKYEVHSILAFVLTITNNVATTKMTRRNTMHKNTRSILGNPCQQENKTQPNPLLYYSREINSPPIIPSTQEGAQTLED
jgi:hypothetical protein